MLAVPVAGALALAGLAISAAPASADPGPGFGPNYCHYNYGSGQVTCYYYHGEGEPRGFEVPDGVTSVTFSAYGAQGATGENDNEGGLGAQATATLSVRPGQPVEILVGGQNGDFGGGDGGTGLDAHDGGNGGGASWVFTAGCAYDLDCEGPNAALIGAGGGGGGGGASGNAGAGGGGGVTGGNGGYGDTGGGGGGATSVTPGTGGAAGSTIGLCTGSVGDTGSIGQGGDGANAPTDGGAGGGGGGGLYGGGGGGSDCGITGGGGGGGGSSFGPVGATFDSATKSGNGEVTVTFTPALYITTGTPLPDATGGVPYSVQLNAVGGVQPYTWSVTSGSLPPGLTLNPTTGVISGTTNATGTYDFTVTVTDSEDPALTASSDFSITVSGPQVTGLRPDSGPEAGGNPVIISGSGLACPPDDNACTVQVKFGTTWAAIESSNGSQIIVIAPPGVGTVDVTVTVGGVVSQSTTADLYGYKSVL
jgi:hypothetical protein